MGNLKDELRSIILKSLLLGDFRPEDLRDDTPLLDGTLEIDSIDVLQLVLEVERRFGVRMVSGELDRSVWRDINSLAAAIEAKQRECGAASAPGPA
jgi:acyl carrier protein